MRGIHEHGLNVSRFADVVSYLLMNLQNVGENNFKNIIQNSFPLTCGAFIDVNGIPIVICVSSFSFLIYC